MSSDLVSGGGVVGCDEVTDFSLTEASESGLGEGFAAGAAAAFGFGGGLGFSGLIPPSQ